MIYTVTPAPNVFIGVHRHLSECEQFGTKHIYINQLHQVTEKDTVIFGAWEPSTYPMAIRRCRAKKKALLFTSPLLQAQMNPPELDFLGTILQLKSRGVIDYLLFADEETHKVFSGDAVGIFHFPHPADKGKVEKYKKDTSREGIFCFMPWGNKNKNQMCMLAAVKLFQEQSDNQFIPLHTNGMGYWKKWADKLKIKYEDHGFLQKDEYYNLIDELSCGIHVTLSESFGYSVLDAFLLEVPVVCSTAINWAPEELQVKNADDPTEIADMIDIAYKHPEYGKQAKNHALWKIKENNIKVKEILARIIQ